MAANASTFCDLSSNNPPLHVPDYKKAGHRLVALKATESTNYTWTEGLTKGDEAHREGLRVLWYHFARPGSGVAQANHFLQAVAGRVKAGDGLVIDCEVDGVTGQLVGAFLNRVRKAHPNVDLWIYGSPYFLRDHGIRPVHGAKLWLADYTTAKRPVLIPTGWSNYDAWQFTDAGAVAGMSSRVDLSRLRSVPKKPKPAKHPKPHPTPTPAPHGGWWGWFRRWIKGHRK